MEEHQNDQYCYQDGNSSCRKDSVSTSMYITLYIFFSFISVGTVFMNLLVIISISHFKQLQTHTNLLILSLAVSDLLVGLFGIPAMTVAILEPCWILGEYFCTLLLFTTYVATSLSVGNLILISIDRYVAVCNPLLYHTKITKTRIKCGVAMTWVFSIIYDGVFITLSVNVDVPSRCFAECYFVEGLFWSTIVDFFVSLVLPCSIIITLYLKIFTVARSQARKIFSNGAATVSDVQTIQSSRSERKAAKTLAIVIFHYLICWIPIYFSEYIYLASGNLSLAFMFYLPSLNSFINPIIYAFFYPWFKMTAKRFLTLKLCHG